MSTTGSALATVVREVESHASRAGWDQPAQLFAIVDTADLIEREPQLAALLGLEDVAPGDRPGSLTPVEQETVSESLHDLLPTILWPPEVAGCAVVVEATSLPAGADVSAYAGEEDAAAGAAARPDAQEARIVAAVLRSGESWCAIRQRAHDEDDLVMTGSDLVPALLELLHATLEPEPPDADDGESPDHE